jgi:drug/metabolite transporter (DMT)-like permease
MDARGGDNQEAASAERGPARLQADGLLLLTALLWGTAFVAQKDAEGVLAPMSFVAGRFAISALALAPLAWRESRRAPRPLSRGDWGLAAAIALTLFAGSSLQQIGLMTTSATNGGFLTACYVVLVPLAVWALTGARPRAAVVVACLVSLAGAWLLAGGGPAAAIGMGDGLVALADVAWALGIALTPMFLKRGYRPFTLAFTQYAICATLAVLCALDYDSATWNAIVQCAPSLAYAGLVSGAFAFTLQIVAQRDTPAAEVALILSLESVFAAIAGAALLGERLTTSGLIGSALILAGVIIVEIGPTLASRASARTRLRR